MPRPLLQYWRLTDTVVLGTVETTLATWTVDIGIEWDKRRDEDNAEAKLCSAPISVGALLLRWTGTSQHLNSVVKFMIGPSTIVRRRRKAMTSKRPRVIHQQRVVIYGVGIIVAILVMVSGFVGFRVVSYQPADAIADRPRLRGRVWVTLDAQPFDQDHVATNAKHLVIVAGHSVVVSGNLEDAGTDESVWWLLDYQRGRGMPQAIVGHILAGINEASRDPESLLVFSGGQTRPLTGPLSEGTSYFAVADALKLWPKGSTVRARTVAEEFATDSFENL